MTKTERIILYIILILLIIITITGGYYMIHSLQKDKELPTDKTNEPAKEETNELKHQVTLKSIRTSGEKIIEDFEILINDKTQNISVEFSDEATTTATMNGITVYKAESDETNQDDPKILSGKNFTTSKVENTFNENNFKFVKGTDDKYYLLMVTYDSKMIGYEYHLYILNDNLEPLTDDLKFGSCGSDKYMTITSMLEGFILNDESAWYKEDTLNINDSDVTEYFVKIENDKIHYLKAAPKNNMTAEERIYTVGNDKLTYTVANKYEIKEGAGLICD